MPLHQIERKDKESEYTLTLIYIYTFEKNMDTSDSTLQLE